MVEQDHDHRDGAKPLDVRSERPFPGITSSVASFDGRRRCGNYHEATPGTAALLCRRKITPLVGTMRSGSPK
jgi:hypothetical protein